MWKLVNLVLLASAMLLLQLQQAAAQGGAESLGFPGFIPRAHVKALKPIGDDRPNDVYQHLSLRRPTLTSAEVVIYPHHYGFEYGQDPEHRIYEVHNAQELAEQKKVHSKSFKHGKHGKHAHHPSKGGDSKGAPHHSHEHDRHHHNSNEYHHQREQQHNQYDQQADHSAPQMQQLFPGYDYKTPQQDFRPRPAYPPVSSYSS